MAWSECSHPRSGFLINEPAFDHSSALWPLAFREAFIVFRRQLNEPEARALLCFANEIYSEYWQPNNIYLLK